MRLMLTLVLLLNCAQPGWPSLMQVQPMAVSGSSKSHTRLANFPIPPCPELQKTTWFLARWCLTSACHLVKKWTALSCQDKQAFMVGALCTVASLTHLRRIELALPSGT